MNNNAIAVAILDYMLRIREEREVSDVDVVTLWAHAYDMLKTTLSMDEVKHSLRAMDEDFLIRYTPSPREKNLKIMVMGKGAMYYEDHKHILGGGRKKRATRTRKGASYGKTAG